MNEANEFTPPGFITGLGQRVYETAKGGDLWEASAHVWQSLSASEKYTLGLWGLVHAERSVFKTHKPLATGVSRRQSIIADNDPFDYIVAIGNTGVRKALGALTHEDLLSIADYYGTHKKAYAEKEALWRVIANKVPAGKTVADIRGKLSKEDRSLLLSDLGVAIERVA